MKTHLLVTVATWCLAAAVMVGLLVLVMPTD